jgi:hypothetical protein
MSSLIRRYHNLTTECRKKDRLCILNQNTRNDIPKKKFGVCIRDATHCIVSLNNCGVTTSRVYVEMSPVLQGKFLLILIFYHDIAYDFLVGTRVMGMNSNLDTNTS